VSHCDKAHPFFEVDEQSANIGMDVTAENCHRGNVSQK
jgi:hypothetical protein